MPQGFSWSELGVDAARVREFNAEALPSKGGEFVLYWCMVNQRAHANHALEAAIALGNHLSLPVVCYHALRPDYPHASDRIHRFILDGLAELGDALEQRGIPYWLELPRNVGEHVPRIAALSQRAAAIVTDLYPTFVVPGHVRGATRAVTVPFLGVDASCVVPMQRIAERQFGAYTLRPKLRKLWPEYGFGFPAEQVPRFAARARKLDLDLPRVPTRELRSIELSSFAIDHTVPPVAERPGGRAAALANLRLFVTKQLPRYQEARNLPGEAGQSGISPALHFGLLFAGEVAKACVDTLGADHPSVASFLEELLVRRELAFNYCLHTEVPRQVAFASLPNWAQETLTLHRTDERPHVYSLAQMDRGETQDPLWNAAQRELRDFGRIHGYLRMLWGKKILEWSPTPEEALRRIAHLNDRYALDGRDPASAANFMWVLGLHDRPFMERPVLGKVRPMSSPRTAQKFDVRPYLARYGDPKDRADAALAPPKGKRRSTIRQGGVSTPPAKKRS